MRWKNVLLADAHLPAQPPPPGVRQEADPQAASNARCRPATTSTRTSSRATTPGTSACAWCPTATSSRRSARASADGRHRHDRDLHRERDQARVGRASSRPTSSSPRPASTCSSSAAWSSPSTASRSTSPSKMAYKGMMLERRAQLRLHPRLHQRLLDAEGRPHLRVRLPPAQPHGRARLPHSACREITEPLASTEEPLLDFNSGYVLRALDQLPKQGSKEPWKLRQNYVLDIRSIRRGPIDDGAMRFSSPAPRGSESEPSLASA